MARNTKTRPKLDAWLVFVLAMLPIAANADPLMITGWKGTTIYLRALPEGPDVQRPSSDLPPSVAVTGREGEFLRFTDPKSGTSWLVLQGEVRTNQPTPPVQITRRVPQPCSTFGPAGVRECP